VTVRYSSTTVLLCACLALPTNSIALQTIIDQHIQNIKKEYFAVLSDAKAAELAE